MYLEEKDDSLVIKQILTEIIEDVIQSVAGVVLRELSFQTVSGNSASTIQEETQSYTRTVTMKEEYHSESLIHETEELSEYDSDTEISLLYKPYTNSAYSEADDSQQDSNECDISFKIDSCQNVKWVSRIPVETVLALLTSTVFKTNVDTSNSFIQQIISSIKEADDFKDGCIPAHILINLDCMNKLFNEFHNFKTMSVSKEILNMTNKNNDN